MKALWILRIVEGLPIDPLVDVFHAPLRGFLERHPRVRATLDGTWLGHPLHPALIPVSIGALTTALVLDVATLLGVGWAPRAADLATTLGFVSVVPAVLTGLTEWSYLEGNARRVAFVHAASNVVSTGFLAGSLLLRATGLRGPGIAASLMAFAMVGFGAWLGGELSFHYGAGVGRVSSEDRETDA